MRNQVATYWPPASNSGLGSLQYGSPVVLACRWQDEERLAVDNEGEEFDSVAIIYPDQVVEKGGRIALGEHVDLDPMTALPESLEIRRVDESPSLRGDTIMVKVWV
jgi:hypothetical protein